MGHGKASRSSPTSFLLKHSVLFRCPPPAALLRYPPDKTTELIWVNFLCQSCTGDLTLTLRYGFYSFVLWF